jgi:hypothetical protein
MPGNRNLRGIVAGLLGTFTSRNNDIDGYWGIGLLCRDASITNGKVSLDLVECTALPATLACVSAANTYSHRLEAMLRNEGFHPLDVSAAKITLEYLSPAPQGGPFQCTVSLTDRLRQTYSVTSSGTCWPHDPKRELRSTRASGL